MVELPRNPDGSRRRKRVVGSNPTEVRRKAKTVLESVADTGNAPTPLTVKALMAEYLESLKASGQVSPDSLITYERWSRLYVVPELGGRKLHTLRAKDVTGMHDRLADKGKSVETIRAAHRALRQALSYAMEQDYVSRNVAMAAKVKTRGRKRPRKVKPITADEAKALREEIKDWRYEAAALLMLECGLRIGEALGVQWKAIDLGERTLSVETQITRRPDEGMVVRDVLKTDSSRRVVTLTAAAHRALTEHRRRMQADYLAAGQGGITGDQLVFVNELGLPADTRNVARDLKTLGKDCGIEGLHPHRLRHSTVSLLLDAGVPIELISKYVGHSSTRTTLDLYAHLLETGRDQVAAAMDKALG